MKKVKSPKRSVKTTLIIIGIPIYARNFNYRSPENFDVRYYKKTYDVNKLDTQPQFYNTITNNCLTSLLRDFSDAVARSMKFDIRFIKNGYFDELLYERNAVE